MMRSPVDLITNAQFIKITDDSTGKVHYSASIGTIDKSTKIFVQGELFTPESLAALNQIISSLQKNWETYSELFLECLTFDWDDKDIYCPDGLLLNRKIVSNANLVLNTISMFRYDEFDRPHIELTFTDSQVYRDYPVLAYFMVNGEFTGAELATW